MSGYILAKVLLNHDDLGPWFPLAVLCWQVCDQAGWSASARGTLTGETVQVITYADESLIGKEQLVVWHLEGGSDG